MTDLSLRERIAITLCFDEITPKSVNEWAETEDVVRGAFLQMADVSIAASLGHLSDNGLAIVPVEANAGMTEVGAEARWRSAVRDANNCFEIWQAMVKAAPPTADLLRGKTNDQG